MDSFNLDGIRAKWEKGGDVVGHYTAMRQHCHITIIREAHPEVYTLIRYFRVGETMQCSVDVFNSSAPDVFDRLAYLLDAKKVIA